ncbi:signal peptidase I [filamentous cyanobacterium CCP5]|nr:signal peptidase I [filamentous cyanobacterium CCP5]
MAADRNSPQTPAEPSTSEVDAELSSPSRWRSLWQGQRENLKILGIALAIALVIRMFIAEPRFIPSDSMAPTLHVGDRLIVDKVSTLWQPLHRGDVVVFEPPPQLQEIGYDVRQAFIKRVIAEPGQTVRVSGGQVYIDQEPLQESYLLEPPSYEMGPVKVPPGYVFVMGDNRNDSNDSHVWGVLPKENVIGRARVRFWPLDRFGTVG